MASQITATLPTLNFPKEVDYPTQEDWAAFSAAAEVNFGILGGSWSTQMQLWKTEANAMSIELNNNADIINSASNYQGDWVSQGYTLGQSVSVSGIYYICKLTHTTGQNPIDVGSLYWSLALGNWNLKADKTEVALKVDKNMSAYTTKSIPIDADLIPLSDSAASFGIKKLSLVNLKATLKTYFDTLYTISSSETTAGIIELATTAEAQAGTDNSRAITPLKLRNSVLGLGQTWQDLTASRVSGTTYTNTTGKPIMVIVGQNSATGVAVYAFVDSVQISYAGGGSQTGRLVETLIVPNLSTYKFTFSSASMLSWFELR